MTCTSIKVLLLVTLFSSATASTADRRSAVEATTVKKCSWQNCNGDSVQNIHCAKCINSTTCGACQPGFAPRPKDTFCLTCTANCLDKCTNPLVCTKCKSGYVRAYTYDWTDSGIKSEEEGDCDQARDFCFDCKAANCAPGACKNYDQKKGFRGGCTACPAGSVPVHPPERDEGTKPYTCSIPNGCVNCPNQCYNTTNPTCNDCPSGYGFLDTNGKRNRCMRCTDQHCSECEPNALDKCRYCFEPYESKNGKCVKSDACDANCISCSGSSCNRCKPGYYVDLFTQKCTLSSSCGVKNCYECYKPGDEPDTCRTCAPGYYGTDRVVGATYPRCGKCAVANCANCDDAPKTCSQCKPGYYLKNPTTCAPCAVKGCSKCDSKPTSKCDSCIDGAVLYKDATQCIGLSTVPPCASRKCGQCNTYGLNDCAECGSSSKICRPPVCMPHCASCKTMDTCDKCLDGYAFDEGQCKKMCLPNCVRCSTDELKGQKYCGLCLDGYFWDKVVQKCTPA